MPSGRCRRSEILAFVMDKLEADIRRLTRYWGAAPSGVLEGVRVFALDVARSGEAPRVEFGGAPTWRRGWSYSGWREFGHAAEDLLLEAASIHLTGGEQERSAGERVRRYTGAELACRCLLAEAGDHTR